MKINFRETYGNTQWRQCQPKNDIHKRIKDKGSTTIKYLVRRVMKFPLKQGVTLAELAKIRPDNLYVLQYGTSPLNLKALEIGQVILCCSMKKYLHFLKIDIMSNNELRTICLRLNAITKRCLQVILNPA